jgi:hypothetical protein
LQVHRERQRTSVVQVMLLDQVGAHERWKLAMRVVAARLVQPVELLWTIRFLTHVQSL